MAMFPPTIQHYPVALCFEGLSVTWKTRKKGQEKSTGYKGMLCNQVLVFKCTEALHRHLQLDPASLSWQQLPLFVQAPEGSQKGDVHHWSSWRQECIHMWFQCSTWPRDNALVPTFGVYSEKTFYHVTLSLSSPLLPFTFLCLCVWVFVCLLFFKLTATCPENDESEHSCVTWWLLLKCERATKPLGKLELMF